MDQYNESGFFTRAALELICFIRWTVLRLKFFAGTLVRIFLLATLNASLMVWTKVKVEWIAVTLIYLSHQTGHCFNVIIVKELREQRFRALG